MPLFYLDIDLGSNFSAICQGLKRYDKKELHQLGFKSLSGFETQEEEEKKLTMPLLVTHDEFHYGNREINCCVLPNCVKWLVIMLSANVGIRT